MILLEFNNRILFELIEQRVQSGRNEGLETVFVDFDGVSFRATTPNPEQPSLVNISMGWSAARQLLSLGGQQDLKKIYGPMLQASPEKGYDVTLSVDLANPPEDASKHFFCSLLPSDRLTKEVTFSRESPREDQQLEAPSLRCSLQAGLR